MLIADRYEPCRHRRMLEVVLKACPESLMRSILGRVAVWRPIAVSCVARLCRVIGESWRGRSSHSERTRHSKVLRS